MTLNQAQLEAVIAEAKTKCQNDKRCLRAIDRAAEMLRTRSWRFDSRTNMLTVSGSGRELYQATPRACECRAFTEFNDRRCWHRTGAKLLQRYHEAIELLARPASQHVEINISGALAAEPTAAEMRAHFARQSEIDREALSERLADAPRTLREELERAPLVRPNGRGSVLNGYQI